MISIITVAFILCLVSGLSAYKQLKRREKPHGFANLALTLCKISTFVKPVSVAERNNATVWLKERI